MKDRMPRLRNIFLAGIVPFVLFEFLGCGGGGKPGIAGQDPLRRVVKVETNSQALKTWVVNKAKANVLIHIDGADDMRLFPENHQESIKNAADHLRRGNADVIDRIVTMIENGGTVNLGHMAGLFDRMIWVLPTKTPASEMSVENFKNVLVNRRGYPVDALGGLVSDGNYITGTLAGVPITVTGLQDLDVGEGDVIIDIDLTYFLGMKSQYPEYQVGTKSALNFIREVRRKNLKARFVTVNLATASGNNPMDIRFLGDIIVEALKEPGKLEGPLPEKWAMMIEAEDSLVAGSYGSAEAIYNQLVKKHPGNAGLYFSLAVTRGFMGKGLESREALLGAYSLDGAYLRGFFQLAHVLAVGGKVEAGKVILETSDLNKITSQIEMNYQKGIFYLNGGRPYDAITYLQRVSQQRPNDFSLQTVLFRAYSVAGDKPKMTLTLEKLRKIDEGRVKREMPWAYKELGKLYEEAKIYKNAMEIYDIYLSIAPGDTSAPEIREKVAGWKKIYKE